MGDSGEYSGDVALNCACSGSYKGEVGAKFGFPGLYSAGRYSGDEGM